MMTMTMIGRGGATQLENDVLERESIEHGHTGRAVIQIKVGQLCQVVLEEHHVTQRVNSSVEHDHGPFLLLVMITIATNDDWR